MWLYLLRRLISVVPTLFIAVTLIFVLTRLVPGNPIWALIGHQSVDAAKVEEMSRELGLDQPIIVQYGRWLGRIATGDFGSSIFFKRPVAEVIAQRFPVTLSLAVLSTIVTVVIGLPLGILAALRQGTMADHGSTVVATIGVSLPPFWLGFLLILLFAVTLQWLPSSGYRDLSFGLWPWLSRLVLPVAALSLSQIGLLVRTTRASMLDVLSQEYIVTARAKGLSESRVILVHGLRNALVSIVTVIGLTFALGLGGSVIIENVFAIPGLGQLVTTAAIRRDYPMLEGGIFYLTLIALAMNLIVDLCYTVINPRVTYR